MEIDNIISRMEKTLDDFEIGKGTTSKEIMKIESKFQITLPSDYKYFLEKYGYAAWSGTCILGVCDDPDDDEYFSMPYFTKTDRERTHPDYFMPRPKNTIVIGPYGGGGRFFMYCSNDSSNGKIELLLTELEGRADSKKWKSFTEFLDHY